MGSHAQQDNHQRDKNQAKYGVGCADIGLGLLIFTGFKVGVGEIVIKLWRLDALQSFQIDRSCFFTFKGISSVYYRLRIFFISECMA